MILTQYEQRAWSYQPNAEKIFAENIFAVIPTRGNRESTLTPLVKTLLASGIRVILINNTNDYYPLYHLYNYSNVTIIFTEEDPPNLSRLWNIGLDECEAIARFIEIDRWAVAILNDDVRLHSSWAHAAAFRMSERNVSAVGYVHNPRLHQDVENVWTHAEPVPLHLRLPGWAFMLRGEDKLRADESLAWWYGDDDLDWQARQARGTLIVQTADRTHVPLNLMANQQTKGMLARQTVIDRQTFIKKWGRAPW